MQAVAFTTIVPSGIESLLRLETAVSTRKRATPPNSGERRDEKQPRHADRPRTAWCLATAETAAIPAAAAARPTTTLTSA